MYIRLIAGITKYTWQIETSYPINNIGNLVSTVFYNLTYLLFLKVLLGKVNSIAGYSYSEMLFFSFVGQINFYTMWVLTDHNVKSFLDFVKNGQLDLILSKPVSSLFLVTFNRIKIFYILITGIPSLIPYVYLLMKNWTFSIELSNVIVGIFVLIMGQVCLHCLKYIVAFGAFWIIEGHELYKMSESIAEIGSYPYEAYSKRLSFVFTVLIPILIYTSLATSIMLGKSTNTLTILIVIAVTFVFLFLKKLLWKKSLKYYASASS